MCYGMDPYLLELLLPAVCVSGPSAGSTGLSGSALGAALGPVMMIRGCGFWPAAAAAAGAVGRGAAAAASPEVAAAALCSVRPCPALRGLV
jgi:hypothetical protein